LVGYDLGNVIVIDEVISKIAKILISKNEKSQAAGNFIVGQLIFD
jgi:hypothetical protein